MAKNKIINKNQIVIFVDRQRNEEKKRLALEENHRLEAEKDRKRKAVSIAKVSVDVFIFEFHFLPMLIFHSSLAFRATNKRKKRAQINHLENHRIRISVKKVARLNHCSNRRKTMNRVVRMWSLIVIASRIQVHKHFWSMT